MATHDYVIANQSGAAFRTDLNNALAAIVSNNSNSSEPATKYAYQWWADTSASIFKIRNSSNDGWINLFTLAGGIDVDAASNFNEDVTFAGASHNIVFDKSDNALEFADNAKAIFGNGDLSIFHDGSNSFVKDGGTGELRLEADAGGVRIQRSGGDTGLFYNVGNGIELYFDNSKKAETLTTGFHVLGTFESDNFKVSNPGNNAVLIQNPASGIMGFGTNNQTNQLVLNAGGNVGIPTDGAELRFGASDDLTMMHDGSNSEIRNNTGNFILKTVNGEFSLVARPNEEVELYYDHAVKLETISEGVEISGNIKFDGNGSVIKTGSSDHHYFIQGGASLGGGAIRFAGGSGDGDLRFSSGSNSSFTEKMRLTTSSVGQLMIGCTSEPLSGSSGIMIQGNGFFSLGYAGTGSNNMLEFNNANGQIGRINGNGSNTSYITRTDYRLKENASAISDAITRIKSLKPYRFNFKTEPSVTQDGFFAHEVSSVVPIAVFGDKDATKEDGSIDPQGIDHSKLVPLLVAAVQELTTKVETLEAG